LLQIIKMPLNKRSIKFLRKAAKSETGVKKMGRKRQRKDEPTMTELETDHVLPMSGLKTEETTKKKGSLTRHQEELDSLREKDPEFFEYLSKNDSSLLDFAHGEEEDESEDEEVDMESGGEEVEDSDSEADDDDDDEGGSSKPVKFKPMIETTTKTVDELIKSCMGGSLTSLKKLMSLFRATCLPSSERDADEGPDKPTSRYLVNNPEVYEYAMTEILEKGHKCFYKQLGLSGDKLSAQALESLGSHPNWKKVQFYVLSFYKSILYTLAALSTQISSEVDADADTSNQTGPHVAAFIVSCLDPYIPLLSPLPRLAKGVLKVVLKLWSTGPAPEEDSSNLRGHSFLRIRQMSIALPGAVAEECFRSMYLCYARTAKSFNEQSASSIVFMAQCVTELYQTDIAQAYQQAFLYIRQLALHLRTAVLKKTPEATKQVLTWQFLNCLRLWTRLLCSMPAEEDLGPLVFPLSQILFGVVTASPSSVYVPLHLHIVSCIQQLAAHSKTFIPTASLLTAILESHDIQNSTLTPSTETAPNLQYIVRLPAGSLTKAPVRETVVQATINLLRYDADIYRYHVGVPEYTYTTTRKLKAFVKKCKVGRWRDLCRALSNQYEQIATTAMAKRIMLGVPPMEVKGFEPLLLLVQNDQKTRILPAHERLAKLMSADSAAPGGSSVALAGASARAVASPGKGQIRAATAAAEKASADAKKKAAKKRGRVSDDEEEDSESNSGSEDDSDSEEEQEEEESGQSEEGGDVSDMEDQVGALDWSDDDDN
jgi:nucleolar complex protein 2